MPFELTQHAVMRFKIRHRKNKDKDNYDLYLILKNEARNSILEYASYDGNTLYYSLPNYGNLYFVVDRFKKVCTTIKPLSHNEKLKLNFPNNVF